MLIGVPKQYNTTLTLQDIEISDQIGARISGIRNNIHNANQAYIQNTALVFFTNSSGFNGGITDLIERMRISPFGDVDIGTSDPKNKLDVNGVIRITEVKVETNRIGRFCFRQGLYFMYASRRGKSHRCV